MPSSPLHRVAAKEGKIKDLPLGSYMQKSANRLPAFKDFQ